MLVRNKSVIISEIIRASMQDLDIIRREYMDGVISVYSEDCAYTLIMAAQKAATASKNIFRPSRHLFSRLCNSGIYFMGFVRCSLFEYTTILL